MADKNDYVAPPGAINVQSDYVAPPSAQSVQQDDYVAPPSAQSVQQHDYVAPPSAQAVRQDDYVAPPSAQSARQDDYVAPSGTQYTAPSDYVTPPQQGNQERGYFDTPSAPFSMYLTGYLFIMLYMVWNGENGLFMKLVGTAYTLISNYTLAWYSDYKRFENGPFVWFFSRFGSAKLGYISSASMNYQKVSVSRGFFGNYTGKSSTDWGQHILTAIIVTIITELLRFIVCIPIAFITLFTHKATIAKYTYALEQWANQQ